MKTISVVMVLAILCLGLFAPGKASAGLEQPLIEIGASLLKALFGPEESKRALEENEARIREENRKAYIQKKDLELTSMVRKSLEGQGKIGEIKWIGIIRMGDNLHVAYFTVEANSQPGCYYYLLEKGKGLWGNVPADMDDYNAFIKMTTVEKKQFLRMYFEKHAKYKIPVSDDEIATTQSPPSPQKPDAAITPASNIPPPSKSSSDL